jgi:probable F420-dependent oxidoreductase
MHPFRFGLLASHNSTMAEWRDLARSAEASGYSSLYVTDHFESQFGPLVATAVAAEVTETLNVGTLVLNNDLRNPVVLAKEIATLGLLAEGRIEIGMGAGWLRSDYLEVGIAYDAVSARVDRLAESLNIMKALWREDEVTFSGAHFAVAGARCSPRPNTPVRLIVGGGSRRILALGGREADIVNVNASLASAEWGNATSNTTTLDHYDRCLSWVRESAGDRFDSIDLQIFAIACMVAGTHRAAVRSAKLLGFMGEESLERPNVLIGTLEDLCDRLVAMRERWGFSNVVVPSEALETFAPVVGRLAGT